MTTKRDHFEAFRADVLEGETIEIGGTEYEIATLASHSRFELHFGPGADDGPGFEASTQALRDWFDGSGLPHYVCLDTDSGEIFERDPSGDSYECPDCDGGGKVDADADDGYFETCGRCDGHGSIASYEPGQIVEHATIKVLFGRDLEPYLR
jgi:hypothetical protein